MREETLKTNDQDQPGTAQNLPPQNPNHRDSAASFCYLRCTLSWWLISVVGTLIGVNHQHIFGLLVTLKKGS